MGVFKQFEACPECGSRDNLGVYYDDETETYNASCFGMTCEAYYNHDQLLDIGILNEDGSLPESFSNSSKGKGVSTEELQKLSEKFDKRGWPDRKINNKVAAKYGVLCDGDPRGEHTRYFPSRRNGQIVGYKIKPSVKVDGKYDYRVIGSYSTNDELFGQHLFSAGGKVLVITTGQEDAMAMYQVLVSDKYETACVSVNNGDKSVQKQFQANYEFISSFNKVILFFDDDEPGKQALDVACRLLKPGQAHIAKMSDYKDVCEYKKRGLDEKLKNIFFNAERFSPSGIVGSSNTWEALTKRAEVVKVSLPDFAEDLSTMLRGGPALGEITTVAAASSTGKTSLVNAFTYHWVMNTPYKWGLIPLESDVGELTENLLSLHMGVKIANMYDDEKVEFYKDPEVRNKYETLTLNEYGHDRYIILDHNGSVSDNELKAKIEYLVKGCGCQGIILDPLTLALSGEGNEGMDEFMSWLLRFVKRENVCHVNVAHVRKNSTGNKANSRGAEISEEDIKGCLDAESEYLSPTGWKRIDQYDGGLVAQWEGGVLSYVEPYDYINLPCDDDMYHFYNKTSVDMMLSGEHRMLLGNDVRFAADVADSVGRNEVPVKFKKSGVDVDHNRIRLLVACAADACYHGNGLAKAEFRKPRKIERFRDLLKLNNIKFTETVDSDGDTTFRFRALSDDKNLSHFNWYECSTDTLSILVNECFFWDGTVSKNGERVFYTSDKSEADIVQFAGHACGLVSRIRCYNGHYHVSVAGEFSSKNKVMLRGDSCKIERVPSEDGRKYCFSVPSTFFLARRNGKVFVTGNSGSVFQVSMNNILLMRDKVHEDPIIRNTTKVILSKNRRCGNTGPAGYWYYDNKTSLFRAIDLNESNFEEEAYSEDLKCMQDLKAFNDTRPEEFTESWTHNKPED